MEGLGFLGIIALGISLSLISLPSKVTKLERQVKKLKRNEKGELYMSKLLEDLKGKECKIKLESEIQEFTYKIEDLDDEWMKLSSTDKKGVQKTEIVRIEEIEKVEVLS